MIVHSYNSIESPMAVYDFINKVPKYVGKEGLS